MRALLRVHQTDDNIHKWLREVRCRVSDRRSLIGLRLFDDAATWFEKEWMPFVRIGLLQQAIEPSHGST